MMERIDNLLCFWGGVVPAAVVCGLVLVPWAVGMIGVVGFVCSLVMSVRHAGH